MRFRTERTIFKYTVFKCQYCDSSFPSLSFAIRIQFETVDPLTEPCLAQISAATAFWLRSDTGNPPRHRIGAIGAECWGQTLRLIGMAEIVNLRLARKRAARSKAEGHAAEQRLAHGASNTERDRTAADQDKARQTLDQHHIETGDRR